MTPHGTPIRGRIGLLLGPALFALLLLLPRPDGLPVEGQRVAAVAVLMATWWMTEALPLAATALLPIVLFPALGVLSAGESTAPYANHLIFLFLGGFFLAASLQRWGLHRRIALSVVAVVGTGARTVVRGFMLATAFLSAWISNTATTVMMLPIATAILGLLEEDETGPLGTPLMLGIAYAASIGGIATLIGTPPNAVFAAAAEELLGRTIGFLEWMYVGVPVAVIMLGITWWLLVHVLHPLPGGSSAAVATKTVVRRERAALGRMARGEWTTAIVAALTALAWVLREPKEIGAGTMPGIATYLPQAADSTIAVAGALLLFSIPVSLERGEFALDWETARRIPWGILLLFGGGLSLARAFDVSGLAAWIGDRVTLFGALPTIGLVAVVAVVFLLLTELTSNTATATMGMPLMAGVAAGVGTDPLPLMATAALASSMAFMLPVATPPNAIVFGSGRVTIAQMARAGLWLNLIGAALISLVAYGLVVAVF
ncbi:MAG: SLC13 family permease [Thermoanaerobaculia bacterium]